MSYIFYKRKLSASFYLCCCTCQQEKDQIKHSIFFSHTRGSDKCRAGNRKKKLASEAQQPNSAFLFTMTTTQYKFLSSSNKVSIVGVPFNGGQPRAGVEQGPARMMEFGLANQLEEMGWKVEYESNLERVAALRPQQDPDVMNLKNPKYVSAVTEFVSKQIADAASKRQFVLTLGGDHSIALATVSGIFEAYADACLIWVDAHAVSSRPL